MKRFFTATALLLILLFFAVIPLSAEELTLKIPRGSNLSFVLRDAGIPSGEISPVLKALSSHINLRKIRPSQEIKIILDKEAAPGEPALKMMRTDGTGLTTIAKGNYTNINMTSKYVYFQEFSQATSLYHSPRGSDSLSSMVP